MTRELKEKFVRSWITKSEYEKLQSWMDENHIPSISAGIRLMIILATEDKK